MTLAAALYAYLGGVAGLTALAGDRIYPVRPKQLGENEELQPTVVFRLTSRRDRHVLKGPNTLATTTWELLAIAETYDAAHELAEQVVTALSYFKGLMGGASGVNIESCLLSDMRDDDDPLLGFYLVLIDFEIQYT